MPEVKKPVTITELADILEALELKIRTGGRRDVDASSGTGMGDKVKLQVIRGGQSVETERNHNAVE